MILKLQSYLLYSLIFIDMINTRLEMNLSSPLIFINLCGLYHIYKNLHVNITIRYGN